MIKKNGGVKSLVLGMLVLLWCAFIAMPVLAGDGDGSGGGQNEPLQLTSSNPSNGQQGVAATAEIRLTFNKNVTNMTVMDNNKKCFTLTSADGKNVLIEVVMADDQIQPELKREVGIKPLQVLESGTTYTLNIDGKMQAKSGAVLGNDVKVSFTTASAKETDDSSKDTMNVVPKKDAGKTPDSTVTSDSTKTVNSTVKTEQQQTDSKKDVSATNEKDTKTGAKTLAEQKTADGGGATWLIILLVIAVIAGAGYAYYAKRK